MLREEKRFLLEELKNFSMKEKVFLQKMGQIKKLCSSSSKEDVPDRILKLLEGSIDFKAPSDELQNTVLHQQAKQQ